MFLIDEFLDKLAERGRLEDDLYRNHGQHPERLVDLQVRIAIYVDFELVD